MIHRPINSVNSFMGDPRPIWHNTLIIPENNNGFENISLKNTSFKVLTFLNDYIVLTFLILC